VSSFPGSLGKRNFSLTEAGHKYQLAMSNSPRPERPDT
jgi:hypothetical protein